MKKIVIIFGLFCTLGAVAQDLNRTQDQNRQQKAQVKPLPPKDVEVPTLEAAWKPLVFEHYFGIRAGYGTGSGRFEPLRFMESVKGLISMGLVYRFDVPAQKYVGCIEFDINYQQKGFAYETYRESGQMYERKYSIIEVPILWQPYFPLGKGSSRLYLSAGPYMSYTLDQGSTFKLYDKKEGTIIEQGTYIYDALRDNRFEYGIIGGLGLQFGWRAFAINAEFRYQINLSDAMKNVNKYPGNPSRSPVDVMSVSVGVNYKLNKRLKKNE